MQISRWFSRSTWSSTATTLIYLLIVVMFLLSMKQFHGRKTGFIALINFGDQFEATVLPAVRDVPHYTEFKSAGYDSQFYAQLAVEPLLCDPAIDLALDTPQYRARRVLFSWTAYLMGLGRPALIMKAYALQNIVAWLLLAGLLVRWLPPTSPRNMLPWIGCLFGSGIMLSVRYALLEGPSMLVLTLAIIAVQGSRSWWAAACMALAGLGRETNLIASGMLVNRAPRTRQTIREGIGQAALVALPFGLWWLYLKFRYPTFAVSNPDSFSVPFSAYIEEWRITINELGLYGWGSFARYKFFAIVGLTTQAGFLLMRRDWRSPWWRMGAAYAALMPFLSVLVWNGYPGAAVRVLLPMTFAFNVLVGKSRWFWPLAILGNLSILNGIPTIEMPWISRFL